MDSRSPNISLPAFTMVALAALTLVALSLAAPPLVAQEVADSGSLEQQPALAAVSASPSGLAFLPQAAYDGMTLTVAGDEHSLRLSYKGGESPFFNLVDGEGNPLPDGTYTWELKAQPRALDLNREVFENARPSADGESMRAARMPIGQVQSGAFTIENGVMVDPNLVEPEPVRATKSRDGVTASDPPSAAARSAEHSDRDGN